MPLTSEERLKLLSEQTKNNPEEYGAYLQKERERYNKRKEKEWNKKYPGAFRTRTRKTTKIMESESEK